MRLIALTTAAVLLCAPLAAAQTPVAIVESARGQVVGAEPMDYLVPGQVITVGANGHLVLSYFSSCAQETVTRGVLTVGTAESSISRGEISRTKIQCGNSQMEVPVNSTTGGGMVFRGPPVPQPPAQPSVTIFSLTPMIDVGDSGQLTIERTDRPGERHAATLFKGTLVKQRFYDFASAGTELKAGGIYLATFGSRKVSFKVDQLATPGGPLLSRLVRL